VRTRLVASAAVAVAALSLVVVLHPGGAGAATTSDQVITVKAATATATTAVVEAWERTASGAFARVYGPVTARIGSQGMGAASERTTRTPTGRYRLTETYGIPANPGTALPYKRLDAADWWVSDTASAKYNTHQRCRATGPGCGFARSRSEHLLAVGAPYRYLAVIDYNRKPVVRGAGSAYFLHVTNNRPTAGCVALPAADLVWLLRWLRPAAQPIIAIGVGPNAYNPIRPA
jgi:L,D-peptidoglycan transpeptidase YkuD (ErfK/YbiS/YcfS/YnhG family)